jgi:hypothetical protein
VVIVRAGLAAAAVVWIGLGIDWGVGYAAPEVLYRRAVDKGADDVRAARALTNFHACLDQHDILDPGVPTDEEGFKKWWARTTQPCHDGFHRELGLKGGETRPTRLETFQRLWRRIS